MISSPVIPFYPFLDSLFDDGIIMNDETNTIFYPKNDIKKEYLWEDLSGYKINSHNASKVRFIGIPVSINNIRIDISKNKWTFLPVPSFVSIPVNLFISDISENVLAIKDIDGRIIMPEFNFYEIETFEPGKAYQIIARENIKADYKINSGKIISILNDELEHFQKDYSSTGNNMIIVVEANGIATDDELAVLTEDSKIAGAAKEHDGRFLITVWGDDPFTQDIIDGCKDSEPLSLKIWQKSSNRELPLYVHQIKDQLTQQLISGGLKYRQDAILLVTASFEPLSVEPNENFDIKITPNPAFETAIINVTLRESMAVSVKLISPFGLSNLIYTKYFSAGDHLITLDLNDQSSGLYFIEIEIGNSMKYEKILLIR
jgi:hypothetical protein